MGHDSSATSSTSALTSVNMPRRVPDPQTHSPKTNLSPEKWFLGDDPASFWDGPFSGDIC